MADDSMPTFLGRPLILKGGSGPTFEYVLELSSILVEMDHYDPGPDHDGCEQWLGYLTVAGIAIVVEEVNQDLDVVQKHLEMAYRALDRAFRVTRPHLPLLQAAHRQEHGPPPDPEVPGREGQD